VLSLAELTRLSRLPKTSVFRVLKVAAEIDLLSAAADGYRPSLRLFELGMIAREGLSFGAHLNRTVESLAEKLAETVLAATVEGKRIALPGGSRAKARTPGRRSGWFSSGTAVWSDRANFVSQSSSRKLV
jgi:DNA-binding IclR family transcriptional regulator